MPYVRPFQLKDGRPAVVREATPADAQAWIENANVVASEGRYLMMDRFTRTLEEIQTQFRNSNPSQMVWIVGTVDNRPVAGANAQRSKSAKNAHTAELGMSVRPEFRGMGFGNALMDALVEWARVQRILKLRLGVFATNVAAQKLYAKYGFQEEGRLRREVVLDGQYVDEVLMARWL